MRDSIKLFLLSLHCAFPGLALSAEYLPFKPTTINTVCEIWSTKHERHVRSETCEIVTGPDLLILKVHGGPPFRLHFKESAYWNESKGQVYAFDDLDSGARWIWVPKKKNIMRLRPTPDGDKIQFIYSGCIVCDS